jgi:hypothetical protein
MATKSKRPEQTIDNNERMNAAQSHLIRFPDKPFPHSMLMVFEDYSYDGFKEKFGSTITNTSDGLISEDRASGVGIRSVNSIELPFPKQLQDNTGLIYNNMQQNPLIEGLVQTAIKASAGDGGAIGEIPKAIQNMGAMAGAATSGSTGTINSIIKSVTETSTADAASMTRFMLSKFIPDSLAGAVNLSVGQSLNPRETISFEGVSLRTHTFQWDLYPDNPRDSQRIQDVIKALKLNVLPETVDIGTGSQGIKKAFLKFPRTCKIFLIGVDETFYMQFKPCMVTSMTVDYAAGGTLAVMAGGRPAGVQISLNLQELQIETAADYGAPSTTTDGVILDEEEVAMNFDPSLYPNQNNQGLA